MGLQGTAAPDAGGRTRHDAAQRLYRFYDACLTVDMAETTRLAETIDTWWPHVQPFLATGHHQRPPRGLQQSDQAAEAGRLRLSQPGQLRTPYRPAHRRHEGSVTPVSTASPPSTAKSHETRATTIRPAEAML